MQNSSIKKLSRITTIIIDDELHYLNLFNALKDLKKLFLEVSEVDINAPEYLDDIHHGTGKAIGPKWAELCIDDIMRTKQFMKGTLKAIRKSLKTNNKKPVTLLYIGTGPFATLVLPLTTLFTPEELQLVLVEVNPISMESLKKCIRNFGIESYVKNYFCCDASQLQLENPSEIDILLLECLQFALVKEQQVSITYNLIPQLKKDVILVPEEIKLSISVIDLKKKMVFVNSLDYDSKINYHKDINSVFVLNKAEIQKNKTQYKPEGFEFSEVTTFISDVDKKNFTHIIIATDICVFENEKLSIDECSLTMAYKLAKMEDIASYSKIKTTYIVNEVPGLKIEWV